MSGKLNLAKNEKVHSKQEIAKMEKSTITVDNKDIRTLEQQSLKHLTKIQVESGYLVENP